jgi:hypothetical protein
MFPASVTFFTRGEGMWDIFEQPWTLLGAAVIVLLGVLTFRSVWDEKRAWWQWLLPAGVVVLALGLDLVVATDREKIDAMIETAMRAAEQEDIPTLSRLIADDYGDSFHKDKQAIMDQCRTRLVPPAVERVKKIGTVFQIAPPRATVTLTVSVRLEQGSYWVRTYGLTGALVKAQFWLNKQPDGNWLVSRIEIEEVNKSPASWGLAKADPHRTDAFKPPRANVFARDIR